MPTVRKTTATVNVHVLSNIKIRNPHFLALLTFLQTRHSMKLNNLKKIKLSIATKFIGLLKNKIKPEQRKPLSLSDPMEANDIIIFISPTNFPMYSVMIREIGKKGVQVVELMNSSGIKFSELSKVLEEKNPFKAYLFKAAEVDKVLSRNFPNIELKPKHLLWPLVAPVAEKITSSHQLTTAIFLYARSKIFKVEKTEISALFARYLEELRPGEPYNSRMEVLPLGYYDVIGMFSNAGQIVHTATVIDTKPLTLMYFDTENREITEHALGDFLDNRKALTPYLFRFQDIRGKITLPSSR